MEQIRRRRGSINRLFSSSYNGYDGMDYRGRGAMLGRTNPDGLRRGRSYTNLYADRGRRNSMYYDDRDGWHADEFMSEMTRNNTYDLVPEERDEIKAERQRRALAKADVLNYEKTRAKADTKRSKFRAQEQELEAARQALLDAKRADDGSSKMELQTAIAELSWKAAREDTIGAESGWLAAEYAVEKVVLQNEINRITRCEERNAARKRINAIRTGRTLEEAGRVMSGSRS